MHHGIFPPWAEMQLEWDAAVRCDCVQMNLSALAPGAWVRPCDAHCLRWLSVQERRGQVRGAHSPHKVAHLLSCDKCNQCRRSPRYFKWIRLPLKIDGGKLAKTSCHCWHKQEMGCCHYRNIQVKDRACKKRGKNVSCTIKWPWRSRNVGNAFREGLGWKRSVQGLLPPPTAATVGCNTEIYEGIMENNHWWEPRALCCTEKRSFRSKQHQPPVLTLECPHWFIRTLFLVAHGTVMDSWELTMIHVKLISEISEARLMLEEFSPSTPRLFIIFLTLHKHRCFYLIKKAC